MKELAKIFALTEAEEGVFEVLTYEGVVNIAEITQRTALPRTTIVYAVESLHKRGLVRKKSVGKRVLWKRTSKEVLVKKLKMAMGNIEISLEEQSSGIVPKSVQNKTSIEVKSGNLELVEIYEQMFKGYASERMVFSQNAEMLEQIMTKVPISALNKMNKTGVEYAGIIEMVATSDVLAQYKELTKSEAWVQNIAGRMMIMNLVPSGALAHSGASIGVLRDQVVLVDWVEEVAIVIQNKELAKLLKQLLHNTASLGESFNLVEHLKESAGTK